jgi:predicted nucleic acid-binding protein
MTGEVLIDTSGFFAFLVKKDDMHARAAALLEEAAEAGTRFYTTDYILDESATLLRARGLDHLLKVLFDTIEASAVCRIEWMDPDRFERARLMFCASGDKQWSFTDCFSFCLMKELKTEDALSKDEHFHQAGFVPLLV